MDNLGKASDMNEIETNYQQNEPEILEAGEKPDTEQEPFDPKVIGWAILELMGRRRLGGFIREVEVFGTALLRIDIPAIGDAPAATQLYGGGAIYCITPTTEQMARAIAERDRRDPVERWEIPQLAAPRMGSADDDESEDF